MTTKFEDVKTYQMRKDAKDDLSAVREEYFNCNVYVEQDRYGFVNSRNEWMIAVEYNIGQRKYLRTDGKVR